MSGPPGGRKRRREKPAFAGESHGAHGEWHKIAATGQHAQ
jgi:hypothetical protein